MDYTDNNDELFMGLALEQARMAAKSDEVPVGAVLADENQNILSKDHNRTISFNDPTAHAEILVLRQACQCIQNYRLLSTTLYVTIEPCIMCLGAIIHARVQRIVFGAPDEKWGGIVSLYRITEDKRLNHRPEVVGGILEDSCRQLIQDFFRSKRV